MTAFAPFELIRPKTLAEAVAAQRSHPGARFLAAGTDLLANWRHGLGDAEAMVDITFLPGMDAVEQEEGTARIGAGVRLRRLGEDPSIRRHFPVLAEASRSVAGPALRSSATLGGNLCQDTRCIFYNQSEWWRRAKGFCLKYRGTICHVAPTGKRCYAAYSGDLAPALFVLGARATLAGAESTRTIPLCELYRDDGAAHLALGEDEILLSVSIPITPGLVCGYEKARLRGAIDFPSAGVALALRREGENLAALQIALTGTNSHPLLLSGCEGLLGRPLDEAALQEITKLVQKQVSPMRTTLAPAHYRRRVASALASRLAARLFAAVRELPPDA